MQRDFAPVSLVVNNVEVLVVNPGQSRDAASPSSSRNRSSSPDPMPIASSGIGSMPHLAMELLADSSQGQAAARPVQGRRAGDHRRDGRPGERLLRRHSGTDRLHQGRQAQGARHRRAEAASAAARRAARSTSRASHGVDSNNWYALFAPAKTPPARIERAERGRAPRADVRAVPHAPARVRRGADAVAVRQQLAALVKADTAKWGKIIRDKKIKGE